MQFLLAQHGGIAPAVRPWKLAQRPKTCLFAKHRKLQMGGGWIKSFQAISWGCEERRLRYIG